jgi:hypothetical protein
MVRFAVSSLIVLFELMFIARMHSPKYLPPWASIVGVVVQFSGME